MRGGRSDCSDCLPCDTDCNCHKLTESGGLKLKLVNSGCCDCMLLNGWLVWNFGGGYTYSFGETGCHIPAGPFVFPPVELPAWLSNRIAAHGGVQQVELYANACPSPGDLPVLTNDDWPMGYFLINHLPDVPVPGPHDKSGGLCSIDHLGTGLCEEPNACDYIAPEGSAFCWVLRGNDGKIIIQCGLCFAGEDMPIGPCPPSSSSSSSSSSEGDSSSSSSSSSSSAGDPPIPPGSSSSSSSSSSSGSPPETPSSSSSSSAGCYCIIDGIVYAYDPYTDGTNDLVDIYFDLTLSFGPGAECAALSGTGEWTVVIKEQSLISGGTGPLNDMLTVITTPPEDITVTATWTGTAGALLGMECQKTFTVTVLPN